MPHFIIYNLPFCTKWLARDKNDAAAGLNGRTTNEENSSGVLLFLYILVIFILFYFQKSILYILKL